MDITTDFLNRVDERQITKILIEDQIYERVAWQSENVQPKQWQAIKESIILYSKVYDQRRRLRVSTDHRVIITIGGTSWSEDFYAVNDKGNISDDNIITRLVKQLNSASS